MKAEAFDMGEFMRQDEPEANEGQAENGAIEATEVEAAVDSLDVQKAVVESLAADKAELNVKLEEFERELARLRGEKEQFEQEQAKLQSRAVAAENEVLYLKRTCEDLKKSLEREQNALAAEKAKEADVQERNPNALALLDRDVELPDRFPGETRDHVLEILREARDRAEQEGRVRRAQLLEGVLLANEPSGNLQKKREALTKFFNDNGNILSGPVIAELDKYGIAYKKGEEYLLTSEILHRTY